MAHIYPYVIIYVLGREAIFYFIEYRVISKCKMWFKILFDKLLFLYSTLKIDKYIYLVKSELISTKSFIYKWGTLLTILYYI